MKTSGYIFLWIIMLVNTFFTPALTACDKANEAYKQFHFSVAIDEFEKCIKSGKETESLEKLANAYKILGHAHQAMTTYERIEEKQKMSLHGKIEYAYLLKAQKSREEAVQWVEQCLMVHSGHPQLLHMKEVFSKESSFDENLVYEVEPAHFNSPQSDFSPSFFNEIVVFSSTRIQTKEIDGYTAQNFSRLYFYDAKRQKTLPFATEIEGSYNIGSTTFSRNGEEMIFTKNREELNSKNIATFAIWTAKKNEGKWSASIPVFAQNPDFNYVHPALSPDGKMLIFACDKDMKNGMDLYLSTRKDIGSSWSVPEKLPDYINGEKDDVFPAFLSDSVLVYSKESPEGLGGLDMYTTRQVKGLWTFPVNLGKPFNSVSDDYGLLSDDAFKQGYFTSTRGNEDGIDNIYSFKQKPNQFIDITMEIRDSISGKPIEGVSVVYVQDDLPSIFYETDSLGQIRFTADQQKNGGIVIAYKGVLLKTIHVQTLKPEGKDQVFIPVSYNSKDIILTGTTINHEGKAVPEVELSFIEKESKKGKKVVSDKEGGYEVTTKTNTDYIVTAKKDDYFAPVATINTKDSVRNKDVKSPFDVSIHRAEVDKVFQLKNIYYDYDRHDLRGDAIIEMQNLVSFLKENPGIHIELSSHTDARGKDEYNLRLSQRRAQAVLKYLMEHDINLVRVSAKGHGETQLVNQCTNGAICSEEEHQANRRTEIKIVQNDFN